MRLILYFAIVDCYYFSIGSYSSCSSSSSSSRFIILFMLPCHKSGYTNRTKWRGMETILYENVCKVTQSCFSAESYGNTLLTKGFICLRHKKVSDAGILATLPVSLWPAVNHNCSSKLLLHSNRRKVIADINHFSSHHQGRYSIIVCSLHALCFSAHKHLLWRDLL